MNLPPLSPHLWSSVTWEHKLKRSIQKHPGLMCGCMTTAQQQIQGSLDTSVLQAVGTWQPDHVVSTGYIYDKYLAYAHTNTPLHTQGMHHTPLANWSRLWSSPDWATAPEMPGDKAAGFQPSALSKHSEVLDKTSQGRRRITHLRNPQSNTTSSRNKHA